jgi:hypothetical protein
VFQSNGIALLLISAFFLFIFASRTFYKIEDISYQIIFSNKNKLEIFQLLSNLKLKNTKASKMLSIGQIILLLTAIFFGLAFIWPFWKFL